MNIQGELLYFGVSVLCGVIFHLIGHGIKRLQSLLKGWKLLAGLEDVLYWLGAAALFFYVSYYGNNGTIRWFSILGLLIGVILTNAIQKVIDKIRKRS